MRRFRFLGRIWLPSIGDATVRVSYKDDVFHAVMRSNLTIGEVISSVGPSSVGPISLDLISLGPISLGPSIMLA